MLCEQEAEIYARSLTTVNELEAAFGALWTQCQRCQGSLHQVRSHSCHRVLASVLVLPVGALYQVPVCAPCCRLAALRDLWCLLCVGSCTHFIYVY